MSEGGHVGEGAANFEVPEGSVAIGRRVRLPRGAEEPITVFVNGVEQDRGSDFELREGGIEFARPILKEAKLKGLRRAVLMLGVIGNYVRDEKVDISYRLGGEAKHAADVRVLPD